MLRQQIQRELECLNFPTAITEIISHYATLHTTLSIAEMNETDATIEILNSPIYLEETFKIIENFCKKNESLLPIMKACLQTSEPEQRQLLYKTVLSKNDNTIFLCDVDMVNVKIIFLHRFHYHGDDGLDILAKISEVEMFDVSAGTKKPKNLICKNLFDLMKMMVKNKDFKSIECIEYEYDFQIKKFLIKIFVWTSLVDRLPRLY